jgi:hypothetical protein
MVLQKANKFSDVAGTFYANAVQRTAVALSDWLRIPFDGAARALGPPRKTTSFPNNPAGFARARPGLQVRFATAPSSSTSPNPFLRATIQSPAATPPYR